MTRNASATREVFDALTTRLKDTDGVLKEMARELGGLRRENGGHMSAIGAFSGMLGRLAAFESVFTGLTAGLDTLSLVGRLDSLRAGGKGDAADDLAKELGAISAETTAILDDYRLYIDTLLETTNSLIVKTYHDAWETRYATVRTLVDDTDALLTSAGSTAEMLSVLERTISDSVGDADPVTASLDAMKSAAAETTGTISSAGNDMQKLVDVFNRLAEHTDTFRSLAEEMRDREL